MNIKTAIRKWLGIGDVEAELAAAKASIENARRNALSTFSANANRWHTEIVIQAGDVQKQLSDRVRELQRTNTLLGSEAQEVRGLHQKLDLVMEAMGYYVVADYAQSPPQPVIAKMTPEAMQSKHALDAKAIVNELSEMAHAARAHSKFIDGKYNELKAVGFFERIDKLKEWETQFGRKEL